VESKDSGRCISLAQTRGGGATCSSSRPCSATPGWQRRPAAGCSDATHWSTARYRAPARRIARTGRESAVRLRHRLARIGLLPIATRAAISTFHDLELEIAGIKRRPRLDRAIHPLVWAALNAATLPVLDDLLIIAGPEAWGRRHNGLRHSPGTGRAQMTRNIARELQTSAAATV
jgi:hypothetical protein